MHRLIYDVPADRLPEDDRPVIVRTDSPAHLPTQLRKCKSHVVGIRITSLGKNAEGLSAWCRGLPIELVVNDPIVEFPLLYKYTQLSDNHPVRCSIPVQQGMQQATKVALALGFPVQLRVGQPDPTLIDELLLTADFYLHNATVRQPVLFFHEMVVGFYNDMPFSLWDIAEDAPYRFRHISDSGVETLPGRLKGLPIGDFERQGVCLTAPQCADCTFSSCCNGYFTWPRHEYDCTEIKKFLLFLKEAALALRADLAHMNRRENKHGQG